jgi:GDPmannose 4,6-dehydratase
MPAALITGINGQDGSYLAELLLEAGYQVVGTVRGPLLPDRSRLALLRDAIKLVDGSTLDQDAIERLLRRYRPREIYNLASVANSTLSFNEQVSAGQFDALATLRLLEAIRVVDSSVRLCHASTSEMFGNAHESPQNEETTFRPRNPYGAAKLYAHWMTTNYRDSQGLFACSAILFNHVSSRHSDRFVIRKITQGAAKIKRGIQDKLHIGDMEARRDWGYAGDYVEAMWRMLQLPIAGDYVLATGETHSVREVCKVAFGHLGLDYHKYVVSEIQRDRPVDSVQLVGNPQKAQQLLGLRRTLTFERLVCSMVEADIAQVSS